MSNLLAIESNFLSNPAVKQALNLAEIKRVQGGITNAKKKKFEQTLTLSTLVVSAFDWFQSSEGQAKLSEEGLTWTNEEFGQKVFGWQKSFFYKIVKAGKLPSTKVEEFKEKCNEVERQGAEPNRSLEGLLKFAKASEEGTEEGGTEEGAEVEISAKTIFTLALKHPDGNISVRVDEAGQVKTNNTTGQIFEAIKFLTESLRSIRPEEVGSCYECFGGFHN